MKALKEILLILTTFITSLAYAQNGNADGNRQNNEQINEQIDSNLFNTWVLVKYKEYGAGTYPAPTSYLDAPWNESVDQDTLIIYLNNLCEWRTVKGRLPNPTPWIYLGNNRLKISGRPAGIMELSKTHLIITMYGIDTGSAKYYESLNTHN